MEPKVQAPWWVSSVPRSMRRTQSSGTLGSPWTCPSCNRPVEFLSAVRHDPPLQQGQCRACQGTFVYDDRERREIKLARTKSRDSE